MGAALAYESSGIGGIVGFYLFGTNGGALVPEKKFSWVPGGLNLHFLAKVLGEGYPEFPEYVGRVSELYQPVVGCFELLESIRTEHRCLDDAVQQRVNQHFAKSSAKDSLLRKMQQHGINPIASRWALFRGKVPGVVLDEFVAETLTYSDDVRVARGYLESQLALLDGACEELSEFHQLLARDIANVASQIKAKNAIQLYLIEQGLGSGFERARAFDSYVAGAIDMMPGLCQRRDDLQAVLTNPALGGKYVCDDLTGLDYNFGK